MPDTILAGPDGQPAIDQATQQPLTIEELLRRRGLLAVNGATRVNGQAPAAPDATTANTGTGPLEQAMMARQGGAASKFDPLSSNYSTPGIGDGRNVATDIANPDTVVPSTANGFDPTIPLVAAGAAGAGALGYALAKRKKRNNGSGPAALGGANSSPSPKPGAPGGGGNSVTKPTTMQSKGANVNNTLTRVHGRLPNNAPILDAEFDEVNPLLKVLTNKRVLKALTRIP